MNTNEAFSWISHNPIRLYAVAFAFGFVVDLLVRVGIFSYTWQFALGMPILVIGIALMVWTSEVGKRRPVVPDLPPNEFNDAGEAKLVIEGPYKYLRHPFYLSLTLCYLGVAVMLDMPVTLALLIPVSMILDKKIIPNEEAEMERRYAASWRAYVDSVPRWLTRDKKS
jgi:protein-S-isoprenylcysteine O-methyltransferase Ste14